MNPLQRKKIQFLVDHFVKYYPSQAYRIENELGTKYPDVKQSEALSNQFLKQLLKRMMKADGNNQRFLVMRIRWKEVDFRSQILALVERLKRDNLKAKDAMGYFQTVGVGPYNAKCLLTLCSKCFVNGEMLVKQLDWDGFYGYTKGNPSKWAKDIGVHVEDLVDIVLKNVNEKSENYEWRSIEITSGLCELWKWFKKEYKELFGKNI